MARPNKWKHKETDVRRYPKAFFPLFDLLAITLDKLSNEEIKRLANAVQKAGDTLISNN